MQDKTRMQDQPSSKTKTRQDVLLPRNTRRSVPIALLRAREAVMSHFRPMLAQHDITEQQWRVIRILAETDIVDASEMAERAFILAPSLTRIIRSLEERGIITKTRDENDGRRVLLQITPAGLAIIKEVAPESRLIYQMIEERFGRERIDQLLDMLDDLAAIND
ncbi:MULTISPECIES: homoprotocatechuate degradation operon regulator HpaR [Brucella]|uniref:Bacterial regulatory protein, MarR family n=19 Tax=Brucella TaxID=234 RepID=Q2YJD6_BRUA2|nr:MULTISPECIES: homoprotocatechuate degradation operon regulator HpaR [Brucella]EPZ76601.1 MarR family transcriptional regulator [Brucella melitensis ADMAS-G1]ERM87249.1 MarR family transcriptional regulator [Brucella abortus 82]EXU84459.1 MarR family transcriptional regulator [Brucella melitensis 548]AAL53374.1 homoprotocatechuate degradative operon repressor [Brucella melitensis bv. 1 str. 16M]AAN34321.1 transcriptional regulator, MarR family [Brucella suis 1330]